MIDLRVANARAAVRDTLGELQLRRVDIDIAGDRIVAVTPAGTPAEPAREVIDAADLLAVPGFVNGHHHSHENFQKGRFEGLPLELWMNLVRPMKPIPLTGEQVYLRTMIGAIEALRSGTTTIVDDMNVSPVLDRAHVEAALQAYEDIGIRAYLGMTLFDKPFFQSVPFVQEHFAPETLAELASVAATPPGEVLAYAGELATVRNPRDARVAFIAAPSAPQRCTDDFLRAVRALADRHELPVIIHVHETRMQVVTAQEFYGTSMIAHLAKLDFLKPATSIIHGVWLTGADLDIIAAAGASIQHNPNSNLKLGSGLMPLREALRRGVNVSLGTDGCGSIESVDMLRVLANTALIHNLRDDHHDEWITSAEAFAAATEGGAHALGRDDLGRIAAGAKADIALYDTRSIAFTPLNRPLAQLTYSETGRALKHLLVDGRMVMRDGALACIDEAAMLRRIAEAAERLAPAIADAEAAVGRIRPAYEAIHARCCAMPIPDGIWPAKLAGRS